MLDSNDCSECVAMRLRLLCQVRERNPLQSYSLFACCLALFPSKDHGNDWCCDYKGVWLCFGRHR